jgi:3-deoxy-D-manno-octulosonic-acid transferase
MGNIKYDLAIPEEEDTVEPLFPRAPGRPTLLGASTHEGEEAIVLEAFVQVRKPVAASRLVIAPRHVERAAAIVAMVRAKGLVARAWSELEQAGRTEAWPLAIDVVVLDRFGLLRRAYAGATACFVGGSAVKGPGGHNLLEAAAAGCPMAAGSHLGNVEDQADLLRRVGALRVTDDASALAGFWIEVIAIPEHFLELVADARAVVPGRRGALERNVAALVPLLGSRRG